jgi:hypothetical protein
LEWIIKEKNPAAATATATADTVTATATGATTTTTTTAAATATITSTLFILFQRVLHQRFVQVLVLEDTVDILMMTSLLVTMLLQMTQKYYLKKNTRVSQFL